MLDKMWTYLKRGFVLLILASVLSWMFALIVAALGISLATIFAPATILILLVIIIGYIIIWGIVASWCVDHIGG